MANRVLQYLSRPCPCSAASDVLAAVKIECSRIEAATEQAVEFCVPGVMQYLDGERTIQVFIVAAPDDCEIGEDLAAFVVVQLRGISRELAAAAARLEGTVQS